MIDFGKRTAFSDTLIILCRMVTYNLRLFHLNPQMLLDKINRRKDRQIRIPFTTAWAADRSYLPQSL